MTATAPRLFVVIPAYNEATRIRRTLDRVIAYLRAREFGFKVLVVDDGTVEAVDARAEPEIRLIRLAANRGKGAAVRDGVRASHGQDRLSAPTTPWLQPPSPAMTACWPVPPHRIKRMVRGLSVESTATRVVISKAVTTSGSGDSFGRMRSEILELLGPPAVVLMAHRSAVVSVNVAHFGEGVRYVAHFLEPVRVFRVADEVEDIIEMAILLGHQR